MDPIYIVFGLGVGILVGLTGIGGGSLMTPLLILVGGVSPAVAIGTDLAYGAITKTVGGWRHLRQGTVDLGVSKWMAFGSVPGSILGVLLSTAIDIKTLLAFVAVALSVAALAILGRSLVRAPRETETVAMDRRHRAGAVATGLLLGTLVGMTSVGSGALIGPVLILLFRLTPRRVVGTDVFHAAILLWTAGHRPRHRRQRRLRPHGDDPHRLAARGLDRLRPAAPRPGGRAAPPAGLRPARRRARHRHEGRARAPRGRDRRAAPGARRAVRAPAPPAPERPPGGRHRMSTQVRSLTHLQALESEAIHVMREVAAELERPVLLFSGGKDSIVLLRLAEKAFRPAKFPFPLMHVDTGHNFPEVIAYRDRRVAELGERLIVASVQESIDTGRVTEQTGPRASRNQLQTTTLLDAIEEHGFDAAFGGARRDEERARAKERIMSFRDDFGTWDPRRQRPELWNLYNGRLRKGEHVRVFPISNWTELDVWQYIAEEGLEVPNIYFSHEREVFKRDGMLYATSDHMELMEGEEPFQARVRYRTVGDMSCTGAVQSEAADLETVVGEIAATRITERGETRADDRVSEAAMEDRKVAGYF